MRCTIYTENSYLELGMKAKNSFLKCLPADENGAFDSVQTMNDIIRGKIKALTDDDYGMTYAHGSYSEKAFKVMDKVPNGAKFLLNDDFIGREEMMDGVKMLNEGKTIEQVCDELNRRKKNES